jgi:chaperonin GroEL
MHATRAAVEEGIVPGGGVALLRSIASLDNLKTENDDQRVGVDIIRRCLQVPARQISINAGMDGSVIVGKILENKEVNFGFDAQSCTYVDMVKSGIIDPTKVVRTALQDAASIASLLITTEVMIAETADKKTQAAPGGMGGMGGMGDMGF